MKQIREQVGLSQLEMAGYLKQSRSLFSRFEAGIRNLPNEAILKIVRVQEILNRDPDDLPAGSHQELTGVLQEKKRELRTIMAHFKVKTAKLEAQYEKVKKKYLQGQSQLYLAMHLMKECPEENKDPRDEQFIQMLQSKGTHLLKTNNMSVLAVLTFKKELFYQLQKGLLREMDALDRYELNLGSS